MSGLAVAAAFLAAAPAGANGRSPFTTSLEIAPDDPDRIVAGATFGALVTTDGGNNWHWICEAAIDYVGEWDPEFLVDTGGSVIGATTAYRGIAVTEDGGCNWERRGGDRELSQFSDLERRQDGAWIVTTASAGRENGLLISLDQGGTLVPTDLVQEDAYFRDILVGPPDRVWVIGYTLRPGELHVYRSDDGAETWTPTAIERADFNLFGLLADPVSASRFYYQDLDGDAWPVRRGLDDGDGSEPLVTLEGGAAASALAVSSDGETIVIGNLSGTTVRSDDGGASFASVASPLHTRCFATDGDVLWSCADDVVDGFAIARSDDFGDSWTPMLRLRDLRGPLPCSKCSDVAELCHPLWPFVCSQLGIDDSSCVAPPEKDGCADAGPDAGADAGADAGKDAGPPPPRPSDWRARGGGCSATPGAGTTWPLLVALLRRRSTRTESPRPRRSPPASRSWKTAERRATARTCSRSSPARWPPCTAT